MDRHDVAGISADDVARLHASDAALAGKHDVQFLSHWFDVDHGGAFCIARAPDRANLEAVHRESHGNVPHEIIDVSEDAVLRFLGKVRDPAGEREVANPFRTVLFTDLEGSTALLDRLGTSDYLTLLGEHDLIIRQALVRSQGREVKHTGDGLMASFDVVPGALTCALAIQAGFDTRNERGGSPDLRVRVGLAAGEPVDHNDDLFGGTVNLASRLCDAAEPGSILVSDAVYEIGSGEGFVFERLAHRELKGFSGPIEAFQLLGRAT